MMAWLGNTAWLLAGACAVIAGVYFTFSGFVMASLGELPVSAGIAAMQSINRLILRSPFMPLFFGSSLGSLVLGGLGAWHWQAPGAPMLVAAGLFYVLGMFVCTVACNVPLNESLAAVDPASAEGARVWADYLVRWTRFNHLRTLCSLAAAGLFLAAAWHLPG